MLGFGKAKRLERELASMREELGQLRNQANSWNDMGREQWAELFGAVPTSAAVAVTSESAKRSAAVYACARLIAGAIALLPLPIYERRNGSREAIDHDYWWMLNESPYPTITACSWWEWMGSSLLMRGDGITQILRNRAGVPTGFMPLP